MIDEYKKASREIWAFFKAHVPPKETDEFWEKLLDEADAMHNKFEGSLAKDYADAYIKLCLNELSRLYRKGSADGK